MFEGGERCGLTLDVKDVSVAIVGSGSSAASAAATF